MITARLCHDRGTPVMPGKAAIKAKGIRDVIWIIKPPYIPRTHMNHKFRRTPTSSNRIGRKNQERSKVLLGDAMRIGLNEAAPQNTLPSGRMTPSKSKAP
jgi:hypothetical protein